MCDSQPLSYFIWNSHFNSLIVLQRHHASLNHHLNSCWQPFIHGNPCTCDTSVGESERSSRISYETNSVQAAPVLSISQRESWCLEHPRLRACPYYKRLRAGY